MSVIDMTFRKRNGKIDFLKFLFSIIIVIHHSRYLMGDASSIFLGGSFAVEFFFLVSGYLMMSSIERKTSQTYTEEPIGSETAKFLWRKVRGMYPEVLIAWMIAVAFESVFRQSGIVKTVFMMADTFFEAMLLSMSGLDVATANSCVWYISSMLLSMAVLYPLIRKFPDGMLHIVLPLVSVLLMGYLCREYGTPRSPRAWLGFTYKGNIRAFAEISIGVLCYHGSKWLMKWKLTNLGRWVVTAAEWSAYGLLILYMYYAKATERDYFFLMIMAFAVMLSFSNQGADAKLFNNRVCAYLGKYSMSIFLSHLFYAEHLNLVVPAEYTYVQRMCIYIPCALITGLFVMTVSDWIRKHFHKVSDGVKRLLVLPEDG